MVLFAGGIGGLLYHASVEREQQLRRAYGALGALLLVAGIVFVACQMAGVSWAGNLFLPGIVCGLLALLFVLAFLRHETDAEWQALALNAVLLLGGLLAVLGPAVGFFNTTFLLNYGCVFGLLGLAYLTAYVVEKGQSDDFAHTVSMGLGAWGVLLIVLALLRSYVYPLFFAAASKPAPYMVPAGVLLAGVGLLDVLFSLALWSEVPVVVMTRRELASFFYSPIAYFVLIGFAIVGWFDLVMFLSRAIVWEDQQEPLFEPIVRSFFFGIVPVIAILFIVPVLTMRSLSTEKRTGTLEVLLTIPVDEWSVVLSKFLATLAFFLLIWLPWALFLLALYLEGKQGFDYRPLLCFFLVLVCTGANFVSMGLFFSAVTRNEIIAAVLAFAGMFALFFVYFAVYMLQSFSASSPWIPVLNHMSFVDLWFNSLDGKLQPVNLIFHLSAAVFWLFLTVKVLEARRWT
jgi:ABC-type transport system involved in multi-copper enzyme maturation permease subunit